MPRSTFDALPEPGAEVRLFTHLHFSANNPEAAIAPFGFRTEVEWSVFRMLLGVNRVVAAVGKLGENAPAEELVRHCLAA